MLALEGVECFGVETWPADVFHALGVRMAGLTWNRRNAFADGAAEEGGGLSRLGRELVDRLVSLGVILDLAHASRGVSTPRSSSGRPARRCSARTAAAEAVYDTPRNLDDDQLRALADAGGLFGLMLHPIAIGPEQRTIDGVIDHLEHAVSVMGADRVCLGGDFTRRLWEAMPPPPEPKDGLMPPGLTPGLGIEGLVGSEDYPALVEGLDRRRLERGGGRRRHRRQPPPLPPRRLSRPASDRTTTAQAVQARARAGRGSIPTPRRCRDVRGARRARTCSERDLSAQTETEAPFAAER